MALIQREDVIIIITTIIILSMYVEIKLAFQGARMVWQKLRH